MKWWMGRKSGRGWVRRVDVRETRGGSSGRSVVSISVWWQEAQESELRPEEGTWMIHPSRIVLP